MNLLVFDFPGVTSQHYDQLCRRLDNGTPLEHWPSWVAPDTRWLTR